MDALGELRVVLVHDWLLGMRGGEKVLEPMCRRWPHADLFTLVHNRAAISADIRRCRIHAGFLQRLPGVAHYYRYLLPIMPWAVNWQLPACDLVVSSSHCVAKGVTVPAGVPHICYCHTPMRYAWTMRHQYFSQSRFSPKAWLRNRILDSLREWDRRSADGVTHFIANSRVVQNRIRDCYGRGSTVIYPPADTDYYCPAAVERGDYYLAFSAFAPYKRLDLAIAACNQLQRRLVVIGSGQDAKKLRRLAGRTITFLGWQSDESVRDHLRRCSALLFPGEEDFGIVPVEAQACGTPVIAYGRGGATETVVPFVGDWQGKPSPPTGVWFAEQTVDCLAQAIEQFERECSSFDPAALRRHALQFSAQRFDEQFFGFVGQVMKAAPTQNRAA